MAIDTNKYNLLYGKILSIIKDVERAKVLTKIVYDISNETGVETEEILKYITASGLKFDNKIYAKLNEYRTASSKLGIIDITATPARLLNQLSLPQVTTTLTDYVDDDYVEAGYVE